MVGNRARMDRMEQQRPPQPRESFDAVTRGMPVIDAAGLPVGTVTQVRRGDPDAVTVQPPIAGATGPLDDLVTATNAGEPDVPAESAARLLRRGYLKIDTGRAGAAPIYIEADLVGQVRDDGVRLTVLGASLTPPG